MSLQTLAPALRGALTEDRTPWANRYVYWIKTPLSMQGVKAMLRFEKDLAREVETAYRRLRDAFQPPNA